MNKFIFHFSHHLLYLYMKRLFILLLIVLLCIPGFTQIRNDVPRYNPDSVRKELDKRPYFSLYKDNYFIGGTTIGSKPTNKNSDVKFQLSISQRLTKSKLPFDTYLFITYTQKAFWNVFQESLPMYDLNFNPGIGLSHLVIHRNRLIGQVSLLIEHESNGKDSIWSRSWNKISFMGALAVDRNVELQFKTWIPIMTAGTTGISSNTAVFSISRQLHKRQSSVRGYRYSHQAERLEFQFQHRYRTECPLIPQRKPIFLYTILQRLRRRTARL